MIWLYIKELAGKDLDLSTIMKFIMYGLPKLMPLVLPLTILLTSIMVFGGFAENYEFAAMKSTGISLQRAMAGLSIFVVGLALVTFWFSNNVIPWGEYNFYNLRKNLAKVKPSMAIAEGQFNEIESTPYNIKVSKKTGDKGQFLENVIIHKKSADRLRNATTIVAKTGELVTSEESDVLKLILHDGNFYEDIRPKKIKQRKKQPFAKSTFEVYTMNIDLSNLNKVDIDEKGYDNKYSMLNISELDYTIDSLANQRYKNIEQFHGLLYTRSGITKAIKPVSAIADKEGEEIDKDLIKEKRLNTVVKKEKDVIPIDSIYNGNILELFSNKKRSQFINTAISSVNTNKQFIENKKTALDPKTKWFNRHIISFHEKLALPFACIILFFVGAPLGALIRKGGIGLPMVIAILLFLTYHFIGIFALNSAKNGSFNPILASWFSTLIMFPLSVYLTNKATADRGLFETEGMLEPLKKLFGIKHKDADLDTSVYDNDSEEFKVLNGYENKKLIEIVKNFRKFNYKAVYKNTALNILNNRGISNQQLKFSGDFIDEVFEEGLRLKHKYTEDAKLTLILYLFTFPIGIAGAILSNNKFPVLGDILLGIGIAIQVIYIFALIRAFISYSNFKKHTGEGSIFENILFLILGLPLFFCVYFFQRKNIERDLNLVLKRNKIGNLTKIPSEDLEQIKPKLKDYKDHSLFAIILYSLSVLLFISYFIFKNNKLPSLEIASIQLSIISFLLYIIYYIKSLLNMSSFYDIASLKKKKPNLLLLILGFPLYIILYPILKKKINNDIF